MQETTCCFLGHREIRETEELTRQLYSEIENLILNENVDRFLFGSKSRFNTLCYEQVTKLKELYPHIKRIYVRAEFPTVNDNYKSYLLERYEDTYYPDRVVGAGRAAYVVRNRDMIDNSRFCIVCYQETCLPESRRSGTKAALHYAAKKNKRIILLNFERNNGNPRKM